MKKLIFSDIDGTLINGKLQVTDRTKKALQQQMKQGNIFIPVSARMPQAIMTVTRQIVNSCPLIAYNGALILDGSQRKLFSKSIANNIVQQICSYVEAKNEQTIWNVYSGNDWYYFPGNNSSLVVKEEQIVEVQAQPSSRAQLSGVLDVHKILLMGDANSLTREQEELSANYPDLTIVKSAPHLLEITTSGVSKGNAVKLLAEKLGVNLTNCWAFGDNYNDETMLEAVGHPILMGNAPAELKENYAHVTADNDHDGIALVLEELD